jgi:hypothetical protein
VSPRKKLWRVTSGWTYGRKIDPDSVHRPESRAKAYRIHVENAHQARTHSFVQVWYDARDGHGWQLYETLPIEGGPKG